MKKIGIIGGMGPESTALFYQEIIRIFQKKTNARYDSDYPEIWICNLPIPDIVEGVSDDFEIKKMLSTTAKKLEGLGADFIAVPCNTVNLFFYSMQEAVSIPVLNIIEETVKTVKSLGYQKAGLLATKTLIKSGLFKNCLDKNRIKIVIPDDSDVKVISRIIMNILNGKKEKNDRTNLLNIGEKLIRKGSECIILGCTDLPAIVKEEDFGIKSLDTIKILAEKTVNLTLSNMRELK